MKTLYTRISDASHAYITTMAARTGLPMSTVVELMISEARTRGWHIQVTSARIEDTERSPADESPAPGPRDQGQAPDSAPPPWHPGAWPARERIMIDSTHKCPRNGCDRRVPAHMLMCRNEW